MEKAKRYYWLDILKIIACFCVIVNHSGLYALEYSNYSSSSVLFYCIQFALCKIGVPIFIMTSGYLYLTAKQDEKFQYNNVLKKVFRIIVPLVLITLFLDIKENGIANFNILVFIKNFLNEPSVVAYWYLYMLIGLYIASPFIKKMIVNFNIKDYKIFLIMFLIIPSLFPIITEYLGINFSSYFFQANFPIIIAYYVAGLFLCKINKSHKKLILSIILFIITSIVYFSVTYYPFIKNGEISYAFDSYTNLFCIIQSLSLFYIIRHIFEGKNFSKYSSKIIEETSKTTFGIYLIHYIIIYNVFNLSIMQNIFALNPNIGIVTMEITIFVLCGIVTFILRKIPIVKNFC